MSSGMAAADPRSEEAYRGSAFIKGFALLGSGAESGGAAVSETPFAVSTDEGRAPCADTAGAAIRRDSSARICQTKYPVVTTTSKHKNPIRERRNFRLLRLLARRQPERRTRFDESRHQGAHLTTSYPVWEQVDRISEDRKVTGALRRELRIWIASSIRRMTAQRVF
jgi:hypothetical protein